MNWIKLFILGLLLALSPFNLHNEYYYFYYSWLGYGLVLISFLFKKIGWRDWIVFWTALLTLSLGLLNVFYWYYFAQFAFYMAVAVLYTAESDNPVFFISSLVLVGAAACLMGFYVGNALNIAVFGQMELNAPYFFNSALIALFLLDYKNIRTKTSGSSRSLKTEELP